MKLWTRDEHPTYDERLSDLRARFERLDGRVAADRWRTTAHDAAAVIAFVLVSILIGWLVAHS